MAKLSKTSLIMEATQPVWNSPCSVVLFYVSSIFPIPVAGPLCLSCFAVARNRTHAHATRQQKQQRWSQNLETCLTWTYTKQYTWHSILFKNYILNQFYKFRKDLCNGLVEERRSCLKATFRYIQKLCVIKNIHCFSSFYRMAQHIF